MLAGNNSNKGKTKKRKSGTEFAPGSSKMKFQMTIEQGQRPLKAMKHTLANDYCQARKQKLANKNKLSEKTFSDQIVSESVPKERESFKTYRLTISPKTDDCGDEKDKVIETKKSGLSSAESGSCYDDNDGQETSEDDEEGSLIEFKPFDLVWAKYHGILWHPAMVMSLSSPPPPCLPIQLPEIPREAMEILLIKPLLRLVVFLDDKSTWKCIPLNKLLPLGTNPAIDKWKLLDSKKMSTRKVIQTAYDKALQYQQSELSLAPKEQNLENDRCHKSSKKEKDHNPNMILLKEQKQYQLELLKLQQQLSQQIISETISQDSSLETFSSKSPVKLGLSLSTNHDFQDKQYGLASSSLPSSPAIQGNTTYEGTQS